jgi:hypothetical protein
MVSFNELLVANGIAPADVVLLRHSGTGKRGLTPYDLWERVDGSFERYECTQRPDKPIFSNCRIWASFVATPAKNTLFLGLYDAVKGDRADIDWECPLNGGAPGEIKGRPSDLYHLRPLDVLAEHRGALTVDWGDGKQRSWGRYASKSHLPIVGEIDNTSLHAFVASNEGSVSWRQQRSFERDSRLAEKVLAQNALKNGGHYVCDACDFRHEDRAMYDAHHSLPLLAGPRLTRAVDLLVLCPTCHRRAHRSENRMLPYSLAQLREWNSEGRE